MAMRDPGTPGRNPFFDYTPDAELGDLGPEDDALGGAAFGTDWADPVDRPDPAAAPAGPGSGGSDPLGTLVALVDALQGAQPEATEHLVAAAHELVLAVKTVVDATEAVLAAQRAAMPAATGPGAESGGAPRDDEPPVPPERAGVRRIDLA